MSLFAELRRRNVFRVGIAYVVLGWLLLQVTDVVVPILELPDWVAKFVLFVLAIGFPLVLFFAWAFELTPEGIKREKDVDRSHSIAAQTGRKLDRAITGILVVAVALLLYDRFTQAPPVAPETGETQSGIVQVPSAGAGELQGETSANPPSPHERAPELSVAVLPFSAMSRGPDDEYFADGLTEEILSSLAQLPELLVTARTSAFSFKGQDLPVQEIADALGVRHIVEGSVRRSGDRLRVTAQLVRARDGFHLWSENYDSTEADTIAVQEDIAEKIASALDVVLDEGKRAAMRDAGLRDVQAFIDYQKGRDYYERAHSDMETIEALRLANEYFERVIERVPDFPISYRDHSDLYVHLLQNSATDARGAKLGPEEIDHALETAISDMAAAVEHARSPVERRAFALDHAFVSGNWAGLTGRLEQVLADHGCDSGAWTAPISAVFGRAELAVATMAAERVCDPLSGTNWFAESRMRLWSGDPDGALETALEGLERAPGSWLRAAVVRAYVAKGRLNEATDFIKTQMSSEDYRDPSRILVAAARGDRDAIEALLEETETDTDSRAFFGLMYKAWTGDLEGANALASEVDAKPYGPQSLVLTAYWCACGAPWELSATPRFAGKIEAAGLPWPPTSPISFPLKDW